MNGNENDCIGSCCFLLLNIILWVVKYILPVLDPSKWLKVKHIPSVLDPNKYISSC